MQQIVPRDIESIAQCIGPLGRMSREFLLIDPYFDEEAKWENGLLAILRHSNAADLHFRRIEVHTKEYRCSERVRSKADALRDLKKTLALKLANGITVRIFIWKQRGEGERFHRRYVLSELGGIWFEGGLDKGKPGETTDVGILERDVWDKRWQQYQPETAAFELIGEPITIVGSRL